MLSLADIRSFHKRNIRRAFVVSDTGGENWGSKVKVRVCLVFNKSFRLWLFTPGLSRTWTFIPFGVPHRPTTLVSRPKNSNHADGGPCLLYAQRTLDGVLCPPINKAKSVSNQMWLSAGHALHML